jgi:RNA polymerase-binding transcription factor DksA
MGTYLIDLLLRRCRHRDQSRPFTLDRQTYTVCLSCGKEIGYSLEKMVPLSSRQWRKIKPQKLTDLER